MLLIKNLKNTIHIYIAIIRRGVFFLMSRVNHMVYSASLATDMSGIRSASALTIEDGGNKRGCKGREGELTLILSIGDNGHVGN